MTKEHKVVDWERDTPITAAQYAALLGLLDTKWIKTNWPGGMVVLRETTYKEFKAKCQAVVDAG